jgi:hypothetical protein
MKTASARWADQLVVSFFRYDLDGILAVGTVESHGRPATVRQWFRQLPLKLIRQVWKSCKILLQSDVRLQPAREFVLTSDELSQSLSIRDELRVSGEILLDASRVTSFEPKFQFDVH